MKVRCVALLAAGLMAVSVPPGCSTKPKSCEERMLEASTTPGLPDGFAVLEGLGKVDYEKDWPKYIMNTRDGSIMVLVSPRSYMMGSLQETDETPPHKVTIGRFYMDMYEVNNAQFARYAKTFNKAHDKMCKELRHSCCPPKENEKRCPAFDSPCLADELLSTLTPSTWATRNWSVQNDEFMKSLPCCLPQYVQPDLMHFKQYWSPAVNDSHPARAVSFFEAWYYCRWVGKDLPTEAEWELAANGGDNRLYPWGDLEPDGQHLLCNYGGDRPGEDGYVHTAPVSAFAKGRSPFGCYNMSGNVWEWCKDKYDATIYSVADFAVGRGRQSELARDMTDPKGPAFGDQRVIRGGAFTSGISTCRTTVREPCRPNNHGMNVGFRGVLRIR